MKFSLSDYLELEDFPGQTLLTNTSRELLDAIMIQYVSVIEPPVGNFVRNDELVLTTAIGCLEDEALLRQFVKEVYDLGACALAIAVEDPSFVMPSSVLDYANEVAFPIISLPWKYRFSEITETVLMMISSYKHQELKYWEDLQNQLLKAFLNGNSIEDALRLLGAVLGTDRIYLTDNANDATRFSSDSRATTHILKIGTSHKTYSYLVINDYRLDSYHIDRYEEYISIPLNFWFDREQRLSFAKSEMMDEFIWKLANNQIRIEHGAYIKARNLGIRMDCCHVCIVGHLCIRDSSNVRSPKDAIAWLEKHIDIVYTQLMKLKKRPNHQILWSLQKDVLLLYYEITPSTVLETVYDFLDQVENLLGNVNPRLEYYWGISSLEMKHNNYAGAFNDAAMLAEICFRENTEKRRYIMKDASCYILLEKSLHDKKSVSFAKSILQPLYAYREEKGIDLIAALKCYLATGGNISETARLLYVHRQTFIYQLKKIESLLNMDLNHHQDVFLLELCLKMIDTV